MISFILLAAAAAASFAPGFLPETQDSTFTAPAPDGHARQSAQDFEAAVLTLSGASCIEELQGGGLERYEELAEHPLDLNLAGRAKLLSTGLFSQYQAASLLDYRSSTASLRNSRKPCALSCAC